MGRDGSEGARGDGVGDVRRRDRFAGELDEVVIVTPAQHVDELLVKLGLAK